MTDWQGYTDESELIDLLPDTVTVTDENGEVKVHPIKKDGVILTSNLPVFVPLRFCKFREYNAAHETLSLMGLGLRIGSAEIRPPSLGVFSLMELTNNPFPQDFNATSMIQKFHVLFFNQYRRESAQLVRDWCELPDDYKFVFEDESTWTALDIAAMAYADKLIADGIDLSSIEVWSQILEFFSTSWDGFEMIPGGGSSKYWFGAETIGSVTAGLAADMNVTVEQILWETPIAAVGFAMVGKARQNGVKGISRPYCRKDIRLQMIIAYLREINGELHPWQIKEPLKHKLSDEQKKHNKCVSKFNRLQENAKAQLKKAS